MVNAPANGIAVPESVGNEFAMLPVAARSTVPGPLVIVIVPLVEVRFAQTGDALVPAPMSSCPFAPAEDERSPDESDCTTPIPSELNVVAPVTCNVPPTVSLPITPNEDAVVAPRLVPPVTVNALSVV